MDYREFSFTNEHCTIKRVRQTYTRAADSARWKRVPNITEDLGTISLREYNNFVTSIPFFNNFGGKAYCRAQWEYTTHGYLPVKIVSVSPDGCTKLVDYFNIE